MADYISREAAIETVKFYEEECDPIPRAIDSLEQIPPADVVEVVRCKDCKHYKEGKLLGPTKFCYFYQIGTGLNTADDDFCSKGERRADNG